MKTAVITGGAGDIGISIAKCAVASGYRVGLIDIDRDRVCKIAPTIGAEGLAADVTDKDSVRAALDHFGAVPDLLVNNAGVVRFGALLDQSIEDFRAVVEVDLMGTFIPSWIVGRDMVQRGSGIITNITSINSITPGPNAGAYPAAKAAVTKLTQHLAIELGPKGIRVNSIAPGFIDGGISATIFSNDVVRKSRTLGVPARRLGAPDDIANAVLFLASNQASYINGHELVVDGGVVHSLLDQLRREPT